MRFSLSNKIPPPIVMLLFATFAYGLSSLGVMIVGWRLPWSQTLPLVFAGLALIIELSALISFRKARTTINPIQISNATSMVTSGIYRFSRNPMYLGLLLWLLAWVYWLANPLGLLLCPLYILYLNHFQILPEEKALQKIFGEPYLEYLSTVRRWI